MRLSSKILLLTTLLVGIYTVLHISGSVDSAALVDRLQAIDFLTDAGSSTAEEEPVWDGRDLSSGLLETPVSRIDFTKYAKYPPHNINEPTKYAYATLLCTPKPDPKDPFFAAAQQLVWRVLWSNWHSRYPFIVFVCPSTPTYQREILKGQGAIVKEIPLISGVIDPERLHLARWRDQLTKLNMWRETEWRKILFLDSDAFPVQNIDELFDLVTEQRCIAEKLNEDDKATLATKDGEELCRYTFGATVMSEEGGRNMNGGVFIFSPSKVWHQKLMRELWKHEEYDVQTAEQGLLDSKLGFHPTGPFPRIQFTQYYNADPDFFVAQAGSEEIKVTHCKLWQPWSLTWAPELSTVWDVSWMNMCRWYDESTFVEARVTGRRKEPLEVLVETAARKEAMKDAINKAEGAKFASPN